MILQQSFNFRSLALNCDAEVNSKSGAKAANWKNGKPVRVIRSYKLKKHSKYAPESGNRYCIVCDMLDIVMEKS